MTDLVFKLVLICRLNLPAAPGDGIISGACQFYAIPDPTPPAQMEYTGMVFGSWQLPGWVQVTAREKRRPTT